METLATYAAGPSGADALGPEAITCRDYVVPRLIATGWNDGLRSIAEQQTFTDGRISVRGTRASRGEKKRADYVLYYRSSPTAAASTSRAPTPPRT